MDIDTVVPGTIDEDSGTVTFAPESATSYGVVDEIARRVWLNSGRVLAVREDDVPGEAGRGGHSPVRDIASDPHVETRAGLRVGPSVGL